MNLTVGDKLQQRRSSLDVGEQVPSLVGGQNLRRRRRPVQRCTIDLLE